MDDSREMLVEFNRELSQALVTADGAFYVLADGESIAGARRVQPVLRSDGTPRLLVDGREVELRSLTFEEWCVARSTAGLQMSIAARTLVFGPSDGAVRDENAPEYRAGRRRGVGPRRWTEEPVGPLHLIVMALGRELHDRERPGNDWFGLVGSSVQSFCRRACEARGIDWKWVVEAMRRESLDEGTEPR